MFNWLRTRSRRDLVLALAVAGGFVLLVGSVARAVVHRVEHHATYRAVDGGGAVYDRGFEVGSTGRLQIQLGEVDIQIRSGPSGEARVRFRIDGTSADASEVLADMGVRVEQVDGGLRIAQEADDRWGVRDDRDLDVRLEVMVPRGFDVQARTGDGDVRLEAFEGSVEVQTGDGDISIERAGGSGVRLQTGDGNVAIARASSGDVSIQTGDGDVSVGRVEGRLEARTGDGSIRIEELSGELRASTGDGDVQVALARFEGLEIRTGDGDVTIYADRSIRADVDFSGGDFFLGDAFAMPAQLDSHRLEGALNGGGAHMNVRVGDGTIRLVER